MDHDADDEFARPQQRLHELLSLAADGELREDDSRELGTLLRSDAAARAAYADYMTVHALLAWRHGAVPALEMPLASTVERGVSSKSNVRRWALGAVAASLAALVAGAAIYFSQSAAPPQRAAPQRIAVVLEQNDTKLASGESLATDEWLTAGHHRMSEGTARIALTSGVNLALEGPVDFELTATERLHLRRGRVRAYVPVAARGFTITTSRGVQIVDLGTDFGVAVDAEQNVDVVVYTGSVLVNGRSTLAAGESLRIASDGKILPGDAEQIEQIPTLHMP